MSVTHAGRDICTECHPLPSPPPPPPNKKGKTNPGLFDALSAFTNCTLLKVQNVWELPKVLYMHRKWLFQRDILLTPLRYSSKPKAIQNNIKENLVHLFLRKSYHCAIKKPLKSYSYVFTFCMNIVWMYTDSKNTQRKIECLHSFQQVYQGHAKVQLTCFESHMYYV